MKIFQLIDPSISREQLAEVLILGRVLMSLGHDVRLFHRLDEDSAAPFKEAGITTTRCRLGGGMDFISPIVVSRVIDRDDRVVLQVFTPGVLTCASRVRRLAPEGSKVRIAYHTGRTLPQFSSPAKERLAGEPDIYIVPFEETAARLVDVSPLIPSEHIAVVAPHLDQQLPLPSPADISHTSFTLLFYGCINPAKGLDRLIAALENLTDDKLKVIVAGTGQGRDVMPILRRTRASAVNSMIDWAGDPRNPDSLISTADAAVFPTVRECDDFRPMLMAMRHGLPVIASSFSSAPHIFENSDQYIAVDSNNPELLAEAIRKVVSDSSLRRQLSEVSVSRYSAMTQGTLTAEQLISLYISILTTD